MVRRAQLFSSTLFRIISDFNPEEESLSEENKLRFLSEFEYRFNPERKEYTLV